MAHFPAATSERRTVRLVDARAGIEKDLPAGWQVKTARKWGYNTFHFGVGPTVSDRVRETIFRLWETNIVRVKDIYPDPQQSARTVTAYILDTGGWQTMLTMGRINDILGREHYGCGWRLWTEKRVWYVSYVGQNHTYPNPKTHPTWQYQDGIILYSDGHVDNGLPYAWGKGLRRALEKAIAAYKEDVTRVLAEEGLPYPNGGDCWYCHFHTTDAPRLSLGDKTGNHDHLLSHVYEHYVHGSLLFNAVAAKGYRDPWFILEHYQQDVPQAVEKYLRERLLSLAFLHRLVDGLVDLDGETDDGQPLYATLTAAIAAL